jgi:hypothetical protein
MSNHKKLVFFNKEGDSLNTRYNEKEERFECDLLFHENSSDTYKTYGLYMMEKIPAFEFEMPGSLSLEKFQLFNEWGMHFYGSPTQSFPILGIEPTNNDSQFYSKWIYGKDFDTLFPIGTLVTIQESFIEFTSNKRAYAVIQTKRDAIMIVSDVDNSTFELNYYSSYNDTENYYVISGDDTEYKLHINGINAIGIYNYIDSSLKNNLSKWSEPSFYERIYIDQKLNIINTQNNDGMTTVVDGDLTDMTCFEYYAGPISDGETLTIEYKSMAGAPMIYNGIISIADGKISFEGAVPDVIRPGSEIRIVGSTLNTNVLKISDIPSFESISKTTFFATQSLVTYKGSIYECVNAYNHVFGGTTTKSIDPYTSPYYWSISTRVAVDQKTYPESLQNAQVYLNTDRLYFEQSFTQSTSMTMAIAAEKYSDTFKSLGIDLYAEKGILKADLIYPSRYAEVNFFAGNKSIGGKFQTNERLIQVKEILIPEMNYDKSENFRYNVVFTDIDNYGIKIFINNECYDEEAFLIRTGTYIDIERSIDKTLRNWLERNYMRLYLLGITSELEHIGTISSQFYNSIVFKTEYPNVPIKINRIEVGEGGEFHIEHSRVLFTNPLALGSTLNIKINGKDYQTETIWDSNNPSTTYKLPNIPATLDQWVSDHGEYLSERGLLATNINSMIKFDVTRTDIDFEYEVKNGLLSLPGQKDVVITNKIKGSHGVLIASNTATLPIGPSFSFLDNDFSTGMVISINNTVYPLMNLEFNVNKVDDSKIGLSYQGPFWGLTDSICTSSSYVSVAFNSGFGQTACVPIPKLGQGSPFREKAYNDASFTLYKYSTIYNKKTLSLENVNGSNNMVDMKYLQISDTIFVLGENLIAIDATRLEYTTFIPLVGNSNPIKMEYNDFNNYLYCLSKNKIYVIDPILNILITSIDLIGDASDMIISRTNGDIYISYSSTPKLTIFDWSNTLVKTHNINGCTMIGKMSWNIYEDDAYATTDGNKVIRFDGTTRNIKSEYPITGLRTNAIFYDPASEAVYIWSNTNIWKISSGTEEMLTIPNGGTFTDAIFNNITGEINISDNAMFRSLDIYTDQTSISENIGSYGYISLNQYDGLIYMSSKTKDFIYAIDPTKGWIAHDENIIGRADKIIYNPSRKSTCAIIPGKNSIIEITPNVDTSIVFDKKQGTNIDESRYGTLSDGYSERESVWIKTREYFRRPRENYEGETKVTYYYEWFDDQTPEFFLYDTTGEHLEKSGSYSYTGVVPLGDVPLNKKPNRDISKRDQPQYQQTIFDTISYELEYLNSDSSPDNLPRAIQTFIGFKSDEEGTKESILQLYKKEEVDFTISTTANNRNTISFYTDIINGERVGIIKLSEQSTENFTNKGLKRGQTLWIEIYDITNQVNQYTSSNSGSIFRIKEIYTKSITLEFFEEEDYIETEETAIVGYPTTNDTTYLKTRFIVADTEIARFNLYGQTEIEDIRYKIQLNNIGKNINTEDVFIFKEYDIQEGGVDWGFLNTKRKEMLMNKNIIYTYIGAYKSIINAINFFGYNDLALNEYYRNTITSSKDFGKLFKVEIPDIFDNTVEGWEEKDFLKYTFPNENYETTNLLNLSYDITDKDGEIILDYTIEEVMVKLQGLKFWLSKNIIPLTNKILDITGKAHFTGGTQISHQLHDVRIFRIRDNSTPITAKITEAYLLPVNSGSTVYNCVVDFYTVLEGIGAEKMHRPGITPMPNNEMNIELPDSFNIKIRTYKTYKEWNPFTTYKKGERVIYYDVLYESTNDSNKMNNPRKYTDVAEWSVDTQYDVTNLVKYERRIYSYSGLGTENDMTPLLDNGDNKNWIDVTEWMQIDYDPVQTLSENRKIEKGLTSSNPILPYNFTIDSNIDPFIWIEVTTDNGYGGIYTDSKTYEIRGTKDISDQIRPIERIGPFRPIVKI